MNTIGIDYQPTVTFIALREGESPAAQATGVGDGMRSLIPNAATADGLWGSRAGDVSGALVAPHADSAWVEEPGAQIFWNGVFARLSSYLGRMAPVRRNGYRAVIALQGAQFGIDAHAVAALARGAGLDEVTVIPATHALFCRWLASAPESSAERPRSVVAVVSGEASTLVCGFWLEWNSRELARVDTASTPLAVPDSGFATWNNSLLELLWERLKEDQPAHSERQLRDAALRFAARLSQSDWRQQVEWRENLADRLYAPFFLSAEHCAQWAPAVAFAQRLPEAIKASLRGISSTAPDLVLVGGMGAIWPLAGKIAVLFGPVWQGGAVNDDIATGATWWGELCDHPSGMLLDVEPGAAMARENVPPTHASSEARVALPPWQRGDLDVE